MSLRRKHYPRPDNIEGPTYKLRARGDNEGAGLLLDDMVDSIICQIRDPFATYVNHNHYHDVLVLSNEDCLGSVVAGVSEALGLPPGLSFEDVFARIS